MVSVLLSLGYAFSWGVGQTLSKVALKEVLPSTVLVVQLGSSVVFLAALYGVRYRRFPFSVGSLKQGGAGVFEPALTYMFGTFGLSLTTASAATLIGASEVVLTVVFAALFLCESLTRKLLLLSALSFAGISLLFVGERGGSGSISLTGNLLVLLGTLFAVIYALYSKRVVQRPTRCNSPPRSSSSDSSRRCSVSGRSHLSGASSLCNDRRAATVIAFNRGLGRDAVRARVPPLPYCLTRDTRQSGGVFRGAYSPFRGGERGPAPRRTTGGGAVARGGAHHRVLVL